VQDIRPVGGTSARHAPSFTRTLALARRDTVIVASKSTIAHSQCHLAFERREMPVHKMLVKRNAETCKKCSSRDMLVNNILVHNILDHKLLDNRDASP